jgi:hypothetical protein
VPCATYHTRTTPIAAVRGVRGGLCGPQGLLTACVAAQAVSSRGVPERRTSLKIMVSPVRIRVPPLIKVLQIEEK